MTVSTGSACTAYYIFATHPIICSIPYLVYLISVSVPSREPQHQTIFSIGGSIRTSPPFLFRPRFRPLVLKFRVGRHLLIAPRLDILTLAVLLNGRLQFGRFCLHHFQRRLAGKDCRFYTDYSISADLHAHRRRAAGTDEVIADAVPVSRSPTSVGEEKNSHRPWGRV
jgi:hypothetical protein